MSGDGSVCVGDNGDGGGSVSDSAIGTGDGGIDSGGGSGVYKDGTANSWCWLYVLVCMMFSSPGELFLWISD